MTMDKFGKYIGVQGVIAFIMVVGFVIASLMRITLPPLYDTLMITILAFYMGKNGTSLIAALRGPRTVTPPTPPPSMVVRNDGE